MSRRLVWLLVAAGAALMMGLPAAWAESDSFPELAPILDSSIDGWVSRGNVLKDPDNVALGRRFARQRLRGRSLQDAAGNLERILLDTPDLPGVRQAYGGQCQSKIT